MKKIINIILLTMLLIIFSTSCVFASTLSIKLKTDKENIKVGKEVTITVDWAEKMQAADYMLKYDSSKLEYVSSSVEDTYLNKTQAGQIGISWFSSDNTDLTQMTFTFKAIEKGTAEVSVQIDGGFADGNLIQPENYDVTTNGTVELKLGEENNGITYALIVCVVLIVIVIAIEVTHKKNKIANQNNK